MKKALYIIVIVVALGLISYGLSLISQDRADSDAIVQAATEYFNENLSALSPEKEVLGGRFHVTDVKMDDGEGTVSYEDGHNAYVADFGYVVKGDGVSIETFKLRKQ